MNDPLMIIVPLMLVANLIIVAIYKRTKTYEMDQRMQEAHRLYKAQNYREAVKVHESLLEDIKFTRRQRFNTLLILANGYIEIEQYENAEKYLQQAEQIKPQSFFPNLYRAKILSRRQFFDEALELYENIMSENKKDLAKYKTRYIPANIALIYLRTYDYDLAEKWLIKGIKDFPKYLPQYVMLHNLYYETADFDKLFTFIKTLYKRKYRDWEFRLFSAEILKGKADKLYKERGINLSDAMRNIVQLYRNTFSMSMRSIYMDDDCRFDSSYIGTRHYTAGKTSCPVDKEGKEMLFLMQINTRNLPEDFLQKQNLPLSGIFQFYISENEREPEIKHIYYESMDENNISEHKHSFTKTNDCIVFDKALSKIQFNDRTRKTFAKAINIDKDIKIEEIDHIKDYLDKQENNSMVTLHSKRDLNNNDECFTLAELYIPDSKGVLRHISFYFNKTQVLQDSILTEFADDNENSIFPK